jgi:hypothetical protein
MTFILFISLITIFLINITKYLLQKQVINNIKFFISQNENEFKSINIEIDIIFELNYFNDATNFTLLIKIK